MEITFHLNGEEVTLSGVSPTTTLLDWLREDRYLTGTKEGCNEGDCGACSVMVTDDRGAKALNACLLFLPQLNGKAIRTVEGVSGPDGELHPVQQAMITHHGSQCGFCTPGFVMSMVTAHNNGAKDHDVQLAGNLCRCTGYAPIIRAAEAVEDMPVPAWVAKDAAVREPAPAAQNHTPYAPRSSDELAAAYVQNPQAVLIAGATDVALWVTKGLRDLEDVIFLEGCTDLKQIEISDDQVRLGAMVDMNAMRAAIAPLHPSYGEMIRRYASQQVRGAATLGGNIANGSPIGDNPPALIALGATLHLRQGDTRRSLPLEDFFVAYGKQDRLPGEFVEAVSFARQPDSLRCYKLSKRFDQDISAVLGAFNVTIVNGTVTGARIAFGGMAATPKRASHVEAALLGQPWTPATVRAAQAEFDKDFTPMSDMRASARYRLETARNLLARYYAELNGDTVSVLEVVL
ncbi:xanthine dehydrogenase small subunit [Parasedimentitalea psychrophila]|uniref:Xanthine dehydrogenase small subunit n=1 Tax=Parasedimentitalea psychrophila TaxID=2997337 RepID=A0A9Y2L2T5_9RHOB|nr:xanthine dehydrogenase small subunit [Parasedimentitalea psychrophila]WIY26347.1 xanthine dehydrogenase small subunit [Parasedimentitalea psychrophila]